MRRFVWLWFAAISVAIGLRAASAETRPQYGGTLHVALREETSSLDPGDGTQIDSLARRNLLRLIFETLVNVDGRGRTHPGLAIRWQADSGNQRWQFEIRRGVKLHDGSALTPAIAAAALRRANPAWQVFAQDDSVVVECAQADPDLPSELALTRNSIAKKNSEGRIIGTGPFHIEDWQPGKYLKLGAEEKYWGGRAFLDSIDIEMQKSLREQLLELESGRSDIVEIAPEQVQRVAMAGHRVSSSHPAELVALIFTNDAHTAEEKLMRSALAHSIDRSSMRGALLQGTGEAAASLLPNWLTGYGFAFSIGANLNLARQEREQVRAPANWTIGYDANDSLSRTFAERVVLNANDAGITMHISAAANIDLKVARIPLPSTDPWVALNAFAASLNITMPRKSRDSVEDLYAAENELLAQQRVIPLFHLPVVSALSPAVRNWQAEADGSWRLEDVWVEKDNDRP